LGCQIDVLKARRERLPYAKQKGGKLGSGIHESKVRKSEKTAMFNQLLGTPGMTGVEFREGGNTSGEKEGRRGKGKSPIQRRGGLGPTKQMTSTKEAL